MSRIAIIERCGQCDHRRWKLNGTEICGHPAASRHTINIADHPPAGCPLPTTGNEHYAAIMCRTLVSEWKRTGTREVPTDIQERLIQIFGSAVAK